MTGAVVFILTIWGLCLLWVADSVCMILAMRKCQRRYGNLDRWDELGELRTIPGAGFWLLIKFYH